MDVEEWKRQERACLSFNDEKRMEARVSVDRKACEIILYPKPAPRERGLKEIDVMPVEERLKHRAEFYFGMREAAVMRKQYTFYKLGKRLGDKRKPFMLKTLMGEITNPESFYNRFVSVKELIKKYNI